jgi:hypothetical protein
MKKNEFKRLNATSNNSIAISSTTIAYSSDPLSVSIVDFNNLPVDSLSLRDQLQVNLLAFDQSDKLYISTLSGTTSNLTFWTT